MPLGLFPPYARPISASVSPPPHQSPFVKLFSHFPPRLRLFFDFIFQQLISHQKPTEKLENISCLTPDLSPRYNHHGGTKEEEEEEEEGKEADWREEEKKEGKVGREGERKWKGGDV